MVIDITRWWWSRSPPPPPPPAALTPVEGTACSSLLLAPEEKERSKSLARPTSPPLRPPSGLPAPPAAALLLLMGRLVGIELNCVGQVRPRATRRRAPVGGVAAVDRSGRRRPLPSCCGRIGGYGGGVNVSPSRSIRVVRSRSGSIEQTTRENTAWAGCECLVLVLDSSIHTGKHAPLDPNPAHRSIGSINMGSVGGSTAPCGPCLEGW